LSGFVSAGIARIGSRSLSSIFVSAQSAEQTCERDYSENRLFFF
jgi:hypothetical protein